MPHDPSTSSRRQLLKSTACGFGALAWTALRGENAAASGSSLSINPLADKVPHFRPRAKRVIFLFMSGGPSQVDSFDPKPLLDRTDGRTMHFNDPRSVAKTGQGAPQRVMKALWKFKNYGESGLPVSDLFPHMGSVADDLCVVRSMATEGVAHGPATIFMHTGSTAFVRPSMGSWVTYGLGTENENLPGFVSLSPALGNGGPRNYGNAFLPAAYQGTPVGRAGIPAKESTFKNIAGLPQSSDDRRRQFETIRRLNAAQTSAYAEDSEWDAVLASYELAWRMQTAAPSALDLAGESQATLKLYGIGEEPTDNYGRLCLMARKLVESGVRYVQVNYTDNTNNPSWDQHSNMPKHEDHARAVDKPVAALVRDLKARGLLEDTIVWWGGEFGRTPYAQQNGTGRDHNPGGFSVWLAGGGFKAGTAFGATDEYGFQAVENRVHMHDLHATILHAMGLDHERLTFRHAGRDFRLTDVHGEVVHGLFA
jgi:hypothetical protein